MNELPADAVSVGLSGSIAGGAMAGLVEAAEPFDFDVNHVPGMVPLVVADRLVRFQVKDAAETDAGAGSD